MPWPDNIWDTSDQRRLFGGRNTVTTHNFFGCGYVHCLILLILYVSPVLVCLSSPLCNLCSDQLFSMFIV